MFPYFDTSPEITCMNHKHDSKNVITSAEAEAQDNIIKYEIRKIIHHDIHLYVFLDDDVDVYQHLIN
jgi:hypothetical protein